MSLVRIVRQIESFHFSSIKRDERCHYCRKLGHAKHIVINCEIKWLLRVMRIM
ncbi:hypothetical protein Gotri_007286 [Gossypium trilobum]|uniref:Uncharacterized protein n=1 Tax=Gossypium trilobum TaxID=34281 RepID=A0A7J9EH36_9ROSI|nr:hypothetical protein [Gossypium trilobum]